MPMTWVMKIFFGRVFHLMEGLADNSKPLAVRFRERRYAWG